MRINILGTNTRRILILGGLVLIAMLGFVYGWYYHWGDPTFSAENPGVRGGTLHPTFAYETLPVLIDESEVIVIAEVGQLLAQDYHRKYQLDDFTPAKLAEYGGDEFVYGMREAYYQIQVEEILKGQPSEPFVLMRVDSGYYEKIDMLPLITGQ